jgi:hypothetical protein
LLQDEDEYALELVLGGGGDETDSDVGDRLPKLNVGVVSFIGDFGGRMGGKAAIRGSEGRDGMEPMLVVVGAGDGGIKLGSVSCHLPAQWTLRPP